MKKVKLGLQRGYSRNMPPKVFNGATSVSQARMERTKVEGATRRSSGGVIFGA